MRFHVHVLRGREEWSGPVGDDLAWYLHRALGRFSRDGFHCEIRVSTCKTWSAAKENIAVYDLDWSELAPPNEEPLGRFAGSAPRGIVERIEHEWRHGRAVWLFMFNADSDLCFEEVLVPATA